MMLVSHCTFGWCQHGIHVCVQECMRRSCSLQELPSMKGYSPVRQLYARMPTAHRSTALLTK
jgi:hypothetical protein